MTRITYYIVLIVLGFAFTASLPYSISSAEETRDTCVECHSNPDFLVKNKKLYDYYQQWLASVHNESGVTCSDCHGGNPEAADKAKAHGTGLGESTSNSAINFKNIPKTCGKCHEDILEGFETSKHFKHVLAKKQEKQGPTCVTCHGSMNVSILNVNSVKASCERCHNEQTGNHPENPEKAQEVLNHFLSIHRGYRYLTTRMDPKESKAFFVDLDKRMNKLSVTWHTFDLDAIDNATKEILKLLKDKREEVRQKISESKEETKE